jgi:hypothetical protein
MEHGPCATQDAVTIAQLALSLSCRRGYRVYRRKALKELTNSKESIEGSGRRGLPMYAPENAFSFVVMHYQTGLGASQSTAQLLLMVK